MKKTPITNDFVQEQCDEFKAWREELRKYWPVIDRNQDLYEFYREQGETDNNISLNTPFAIVESMISKANDTTLDVIVKAKGENGLLEFGTYIGAIIKDAIEDVDVAQVYGSFRKTKENFLREFLVKGNAIAMVEYCYKKSGGKVIADNPYTRILNYKNVIFDPTKTLSTSGKYYIESYTTWKDLTNNEYDTKTGKGLYKNLGEVKKYKDDKSQDSDEYNISGDRKIKKRVAPIHILEIFEGTSYKVIANDKILIREEDDPMKVGGHTLVTAMDYVIGDRPYAYGEIDAIREPTLAQDKIINSSLDMVDRYNRPSIVVDDPSMDLDELIMIIENGGVMFGNSKGVASVPVNVPPAQAFQTVDVMQQAVERAARFSPYASGMPSAQTDKTQGTMGGIQALQAASEPNFKIKLDALEESFMQPVAMLYLKMIASLMGRNETRYGILRNKKSEYVTATKGILQGKATITDLVITGLLTEK